MTASPRRTPRCCSSSRTCNEGRATPRRAASARALAEERHLGRLHQDDEIEQQAVVLDVVEVILQLLHGILLGRSVRIAQLRPAGDPGLQAMPLEVVRNLLGELRHELRALGTRAERPEFVAELSKKSPYYFERHCLK